MTHASEPEPDRPTTGRRSGVGPPSPDPGRAELQGAVDILQDLSEREIDEMLSGTSMRTADRGTVFSEAERSPEALFLLKSGRVELYRQSPEGKKLTLAIVESGTFFGEMSLLTQRLAGTSAVALEDSEVCTLGRRDVESLMLDHPSVAFRLIEALADRLQHTSEALVEMAFNDVTGRVAALLLRLADEETDEVVGYSHQDLAAMVGCLRESLTATLDGLKRTQAVAISRKKITITDRAQLEGVVTGRSD